MIRTVITIVFIVVCVTLSALVLMQESKNQGLGALTGSSSSDTYWGKNKGRSMEGMLIKLTRILAIAFVLLALVLNLTLY